jgi:hypothetical protein
MADYRQVHKVTGMIVYNGIQLSIVHITHNVLSLSSTCDIGKIRAALPDFSPLS